MTDRTLAAVFFVGQAARTKDNLSPNQLRKGLDQLEAKGVIQSEGAKGFGGASVLDAC